MAAALIAALRDRQVPVLALDGNILRGRLCRNLGFSDPNRMENLRRASAAYTMMDLPSPRTTALQQRWPSP